MDIIIQCYYMCKIVLSFLFNRPVPWLISLMVTPVDAVPYFLLTNTRPKCFTVEGPRATTLIISYDAPDMVMLPEDDSEALANSKQREQPDSRPHGGLDERFNKRYQDKMVAMQRAGRNMADISIVTYQQGDTVSSGREWKVAGGDSSASGRVRQELTERQGKLEFTTNASRDTPVEICVQSMAANVKNPSRVALTISQNVNVNKQSKEKKQEQEREAQKHMSKLARELSQLDRKAALVLTNADYAKEQEVEFHELSLKMNQASKWWPMIHLGILVITALTVINHFIRFFKNRHIY